MLAKLLLTLEILSLFYDFGNLFRVSPTICRDPQVGCKSILGDSFLNRNFFVHKFEAYFKNMRIVLLCSLNAKLNLSQVIILSIVTIIILKDGIIKRRPKPWQRDINVRFPIKTDILCRGVSWGYGSHQLHVLKTLLWDQHVSWLWRGSLLGEILWLASNWNLP